MRGVAQIGVFVATAALATALSWFPVDRPAHEAPSEAPFRLTFCEIAPEDAAAFARIARMSWQIRGDSRRFAALAEDPAVLAERPPDPPPPLACEFLDAAPVLPPVAASFAGFAAPRAARVPFRAVPVTPPAAKKKGVRDAWLLSLDNFETTKEKMP